MDGHAAGCDFGVPSELGGEGMVVCGEETDAADVRGDVVEDGLGYCYTVVSTCSSS